MTGKEQQIYIMHRAAGGPALGRRGWVHWEKWSFKSTNFNFKTNAKQLYIYVLLHITVLSWIPLYSDIIRTVELQMFTASASTPTLTNLRSVCSEFEISQNFLRQAFSCERKLAIILTMSVKSSSSSSSDKKRIVYSLRFCSSNRFLTFLAQIQPMQIPALIGG